jgi:acyl carrier protein
VPHRALLARNSLAYNASGWRAPATFRAARLPISGPVSVQAPATLTDIEREVAALIIGALRLDIVVDDFRADTPLFGDELGLDSIDMLEIALAVSKQYGFEIRADSVDNERIFSSLRALAAHVATHRTR